MKRIALCVIAVVSIAQNMQVQSKSSTSQHPVVQQQHGPIVNVKPTTIQEKYAEFLANPHKTPQQVQAWGNFDPKTARNENWSNSSHVKWHE